jgi:excisionase family DNA binding protein
MSERLLKAGQVAKRLGVSPSRVHALARDGLISYRSVGARSRRFTDADVDEFIEQSLRRERQDVPSEGRWGRHGAA